jgi:signal transduction histidine kinase
MQTEELYQIPLFEGITDGEFQWLLDNSREVHLDKGEYFLREHDPETKFYIVLDGELQVSRIFNRETMVLGTTPRGIIGGELSILNDTPSEVTARTILPSTLLVFEPQAFRAIFSACPVVGGRILRIAAERMSSVAARVTQQEKMAALGKLSAGLAHELNNPASAARRSAQSLREALPALEEETIRLMALDLELGHIELLLNLQHELIGRVANPVMLDALERADREDEMGTWLDENGVERAFEIAPILVKAGVTCHELTNLTETVGQEAAPGVLGWLGHVAMAYEMLDSVEQTTRRISDLVGAIKEYTYMDRAQGQEEVDIHRGLDTTLKVLNHKLKRIEVIREYDPDLPKVPGSGSSLNQIWTNLIDNAIDAMKGEGTLHVITRNENPFAMVEIQDSGPGIPPDIMPHIFEPFFTTKGVGAGTGLGLDIVYRIIRQHSATIEVQSRPGETRFIVRLPVPQK